jgi:tripartite-type tricarboxylate transporter receptor subunit TctC
MIEAGKLRVIAIASPARVASMPKVPTTAEVGYPNVDATSRLLLAGPVRMSAETVAKVNDAVSRVLQMPEVSAQIEKRDIVVTNMGPTPLTKEIQRLSQRNAEAVKISGATPE